MDTQGEQPAENRLLAAYEQLRDRLSPALAFIRARVTVDTRALAALRIALGAILIADLVHRAGDLTLFYTDQGMYPLAAFEGSYAQYQGLSLHALSGAAWFQALLFVIAGLLALAFALGYRTRLVGLISFALLMSLHARNPAVLNGGDILLRVILLVSLVAPLGERWSIDALRRGSARDRVASFGTAALLVQPIVVFTTNAIEKHRGDTWFSGQALEIALLNDVMTVHLGNVLAGSSSLLTVLNYGWVVLLSGSVLFLLLPTGRLRTVAALAYMGAFAGMALTLSVGLFPFVLAACVVPFLAAWFWDALEGAIPRGWKDTVPSRRRLGPLSKPPLEQRILDRLREAGHGFAASYVRSYARVTLSLAGLVVLCWILVFSAAAVTDSHVPGIENSHLDQQSWSLYAPNPSQSYSWYVPEAHLADGGTMDALDGGPVDFEPPPDAADAYETFRHRKFMETVRQSGSGDPGIISRSYADWACDKAQALTAVPVETLTLWRMKQASPVDGELEDPRKIQVIERACG